MSEGLENNEFDKIVQQKFAGHEVHPPEKLFAQIEKEAALLESNELKNRVIWYRWIIVALLFLFTSTLFYTFWTSGTSEKEEQNIASNQTENLSSQQNEESTSTKNETTNNEISNSIITRENVSDPSFEENTPVEEPTQKIEQTTKHGSTQHKKTINLNQSQSNKQTSNPSKKEKPKLVIETDFTKTEAEPETKKTAKDVKSNTEPVAIEDNVQTTEENATTSTEKQSIIETEKEHIVPRTTEEELAKNETETDSPSSNPADAKKQTQEVSQDVKATEQLQKDDSTVDQNATQPEEAVVEEKIPSESDSSFIDSTATATKKDESKTSSGKWSASLFIVPNFTNTGLTSSQNNPLYEGSQPSKAGISAAIGIGYQFKPKWTLNLGITHHSFKSENTIENQRPKDLPILLDPPNGSITVYSAYGTAVITDVGNFQYHGDDQDDIDLDDEDDFASLNYSEQQEITFLDIPITLGYELGNGKLRGLIQGGLLTSLVLKDKTEVSISNIYQPNVFATTSDFESNKSVSFGVSFSLGAKYGISNRFSILLLPGINNGLMNIGSGQDITVKPSSIDIRTGLQYNF